MIVKICGITRREDALAAVEAGASALGFIFYPKSPRYVTPAAAALIGEGLDTWKVGVFVDESAVAIESVMRAAKLDIAQIYGTAIPESTRVWKALRPEPRPFRSAPIQSFKVLRARPLSSRYLSSRVTVWVMATSLLFYMGTVATEGNSRRASAAGRWALRRMWQIPAFFAGLLALLAVWLGRPYLHRPTLQQFEREVASIDSAIDTLKLVFQMVRSRIAK